MTTKLKGNDLKAANNLRRLWDEYKEKTGEDQITFCKKLGMPQPAFSKYINGHNGIGLSALVRLADALGCNCSDIREELKDSV